MVFLSTCPVRGTTSFWVEGLTNVNKIVEGDTTYMNGVSLTIVEV